MINRPTEQHYQVPRRFGLRTVLVVTALVAVMLGVVKRTEASPVVLIVYVSFIIAVGGAQVVFEKSPRLGSMLAGALYLPVLKFVAWRFEGGLDAINFGPLLGLLTGSPVVFAIVFGAFYGYLVGTMLASFYLVLDKLQLVAQWRLSRRQVPSEAG